jgi:RNA polymerase sigma-32 factor
MAAAIANIAPAKNSLWYLQEIRRFAMLTPEEELSLAHRWRDKQDVEAANKLVTSDLRLVAKIAMGYRGYGLQVGELISEGNIGMMQAVKRFRPTNNDQVPSEAA